MHGRGNVAVPRPEDDQDADAGFLKLDLEVQSAHAWKTNVEH
jgi:hypothetical protein